MADWRLAKSLITLRDQVDARWPNRNKASDGTIGDAAHRAVHSEHNPNSAGVVTAIDITQDPSSGADMQVLADELVASGDDRIWYIIFNRRIWEDGSWTPYSGTADPHTNHLHLSTNQDPYSYDDPKQWNLSSNKGEDMPSTVDRELSAELLSAFFTPEQIQAEGGEKFIQSWIGTESNSMVKALFQSPQFRNKRLDAENNAKLVQKGAATPISVIINGKEYREK